MNDAMVKEYQAELARLDGVWADLKRRLTTEKDEAARKTLRHQEVTVRAGCGQLRKTLEYLLSPGRLKTGGRQLQTETGDKSYLGLDGEKFWLD